MRFIWRASFRNECALFAESLSEEEEEEEYGITRLAVAVNILRQHTQESLVHTDTSSITVKGG